MIQGPHGVESLDAAAHELHMVGILVRTIRYAQMAMLRTVEPDPPNTRTMLLMGRGSGMILAPTRRVFDAPSTVILPRSGPFHLLLPTPGEFVEVRLEPKGAVWPDGLAVSPHGAAASAATLLATVLLTEGRRATDAEIAHLSLAMEFAASGAGSTSAGHATTELARRADELIRRHAHQPDFSVTGLAQLLRVSRRHLTRTLSRTGRSPLARLQEVRLAYARAMIGSGGPPVMYDDVRARMCGFTSARALRDALGRAELEPPAD